MPGSSNQPQSMTWDPLAQWFIAEGIPITPYDDGGHKNYYPLMHLVARNNTGVLATLDIVLPVSDEMNCKGCHSSDSLGGAVPPSGWVHDSNAERDMRLNVLRLHDALNAADPVYQQALSQASYNPAGLEATGRGGTAILCANCHLSEALPGSGRAGIKPLTQAIHRRHQLLDQIASGRTACYQCHPGSATRCLRGAMGAAVAPDGTLAMQCQSCHGQDYRGTVLSRSQADRMLSTGFGAKYFWRGFQVGCFTCHLGPSNDHANPNQPAVVSNASITTALNTSASIMLSASDPDGNALTLRIVSQPSHGAVGLTGKQATFFPDAGFTGNDAFTFAAWDGSTDSNLGTVSVTVGNGGAAPTPTPTTTSSIAATFTPTRISTSARTPTRTPTLTRTPTQTPTATRTSTPRRTPTFTPRRSRTPTPTRSAARQDDD